MEVSTSKTLISLLLAIVLLFISQTQPLASAAKDSRQAYTNFIKTKCNITTYTSLCLITQMPYASSVKTNSTRLCKEALKVTTKGSRDASVIVWTLKKQKGISRYEAMAIKACIILVKMAVERLKRTCIILVKMAVERLKRTVKAIGHLGDKDKEFQLSNAQTYATAATTYADTCIDGFTVRKVNPNLKKVIDRSKKVIMKLGSNALALINDLNE